MIKEETTITLANEGMHSQKAYRKMKDMLNKNTYTSPRLYHVVFMGSELSKDYQAAMKALCLELCCGLICPDTSIGGKSTI